MWRLSQHLAKGKRNLAHFVLVQGLIVALLTSIWSGRVLGLVRPAPKVIIMNAASLGAQVARRPLIITGPSGVGKGTLIQILLSREPARYGFSVSHTTRAARPGEVDGLHYFFTDQKAMEKDIREGKFLEYATVHGNTYGTSYDAIKAVQDSGKLCLLDIDVQGVMTVKQGIASGRVRDLSPIFVFVAPPSMGILEERLRGRHTETEEAILRRLSNARREVEYGTSGENVDKVIVNDDLEEAYADLRAFIDDMYYDYR